MARWFHAAAGVVPLTQPWQAAESRRNGRMATRTGGPDDDDGDEDEMLRKLMPVLAGVIAVAVMFGG